MHSCKKTALVQVIVLKATAGCVRQGLSGAEGAETPESAHIRSAIFTPGKPRAAEDTETRCWQILAALINSHDSISGTVAAMANPGPAFRWNSEGLGEPNQNPTYESLTITRPYTGTQPCNEVLDSAS